VLVFRQYRDQFLLPKLIGKLIVAVYYKLSPTLANHIGHIKWLSAIIRKWILEPLARMISEKELK
jgi:hypothetical protein